MKNVLRTLCFVWVALWVSVLTLASEENTKTVEGEAASDAVIAEPGGPGDEPTERERLAAIRRLMKLLDVSAAMDHMMTQMVETAEQDGMAFPEGFIEAYRDEIQAHPIEDEIIPIYLKHFSHEDILGLIEFYESPLGQRFQKKSQQIQFESYQIGEAWGAKRGEAAWEKAVAEDEGPFGEQSRQKRAMGEVRTIATALLSYSIDEDTFPAVNSLAELIPYLEPDYIQKLPMLDPWGNPYEYYFLPGATRNEDSFQVISLGRDGKRDDLPMGAFQRPYQFVNDSIGDTTKCFESDIVWQMDTFARQPEGLQEICSE